MPKIGIVTDSTAYLPREFKEHFGIEVVSLTINFQGGSYPEEDLYNRLEAYYAWLEQAATLPTTSQPAVGDFLQTYRKLTTAGAESILSIHLSGGVSGTVKTARAAAQMFNEAEITVIDSGTTAVNLYLIVEAAAHAVAAGLEPAAVLRLVRQVVNSQRLLILPATLEYLRRGGRIGGAAALVGNLLQIRPILYFNPAKGNSIDLFAKVRTRERALRRILAEMEQAGPHLKTRVGHVNTPELGQAAVDRIRASFPQLSPELCPVGPVIGAHVGPGAIGIGFYPLTPELEKLVKY